MRAHFSLLFKSAFVVPAAIALASCGGGAEEANEAASTVDSNMSFERIGNDASALEAAANAAPVLPQSEPTNEGGATDDNDDAPSQGASEPRDQPVLGETSGGDTGGNTVQGNVSGN